MPVEILSVAEKPSVAKELAKIISGNPNPFTRNGFSQYNRIFEMDCQFKNAPARMKMTSVTGHLLELEFDQQYRGWSSCQPIDLFSAPVRKSVKKENEPIKRTLVEEARKCNVLMLWLDCDLEGENIAYEVIQICTEANPRLDIYRARFSALIPRDIMRTMQFPERPNPHMNDAVDARQEIDLRTGAAFTRFQTMRLQKKYECIGHQVISYGSCQFPTLGFVVEREMRINEFKPDDFWYITVDHEFEDPDTPNKKVPFSFSWDRSRIYDRLTCTILYETCVENPVATVTMCSAQPTSRFRPNPMNTIELQKRASRFLRMAAERTMAVAEALYQRGILSYPRTETDFFKEGFELLAIVQDHRNHSQWGPYVSRLVDDNKFQWPKSGGHDDQAHPPIHPTKCVELNEFGNEDEKKLYELVTIHFIACCSQDAKGNQTRIAISIPDGGENFSTTGLMVTERNWLDVYGKYEKWIAKKVPVFQVGDVFVPKRIMMSEGKTAPPEPISEVDLISAMDKNGIGTDATIAQHISTIQTREYVTKDANNRFKATKLGLALVEGYNSMGYQLNKPHLRAAMESDCQKIARGELRKDEVVWRCLEQMKECFRTCCAEANKLDTAVGKYFANFADGGFANFEVIQRSFTNCGLCGSAQELRIGVADDGNNARNSRYVFCLVCEKANLVPPKGDLTPHSVVCPICNFQAISVHNPDTGKAHTICPFCFSNPPAPPIGIEGNQDFRCFSCAMEGCELAQRVGGSEIDVCQCSAVACSGKMRLKKNTKGFAICCTIPTCNKIWWFPKFVKSAIALAGTTCTKCATSKGQAIVLFRLQILLSKAPPGTEPEKTLCLVCDRLFRDCDYTPLSLRPTVAANVTTLPRARTYSGPSRTINDNSSAITDFALRNSSSTSIVKQQFNNSSISNNYNSNYGNNSISSNGYSSSNNFGGTSSNSYRSNTFNTSIGNSTGNYNSNYSSNSMINNENQAANSSSGRYQSYSSNYEQQTAFNSGGNEGGNTIGDGRQCMCGEPAHFGKKTSPGANQGKSFYACKKRSNDPERCKYFEWVDADSTAASGRTGVATNNVGLNNSYTGNSGNNKYGNSFVGKTTVNNSFSMSTENVVCSRCKQRGHYARQCSNN